MAYTGLVPSEHSSGGSRRQGHVTKAGNAHVRRVLVEAAWHYRRTPRVSGALRQRQVGQPEAVIQQAWTAQHRLHRRYAKLVARGERPVVAVTAVARELAAFVWATLRGVNGSVELAQHIVGRRALCLRSRVVAESAPNTSACCSSLRPLSVPTKRNQNQSAAPPEGVNGSVERKRVSPHADRRGLGTAQRHPSGSGFTLRARIRTGVLAPAPGSSPVEGR
jgi:hypothetical protein